MVRSSNPNAATIACTGHPWASNVTTRRTVSAAVRRRYNTLPVGALNVLWHSWQMNRCSFCEWIPILPLPVWPLAGQCLLGQNAVVGSMTLLLAMRGNIATRSMSGPPFALQRHRVPVQVVKTGLTPQIAPSDRLWEAETVQRHSAGPLRTPL